MPVNYRIGGIDITNFRGIDRLAIDFEPGVVTYLIGANNAGKSTVLNAIAIALAGGGHYNFSPGEYDFFHGSAGGIASEFQIKLNFSADQETELPAVQGVGAPFPVHGVLFQGRRDEDGATESQHVLVGDDGKPIAYPSRTPLKGELKEAYRGHGNVGFARQYARLVNVREAVPEVWLLRPDNLNASLYRWQTGPLARLASLLSKRFLDEEWSFTFGGKARQMPQQLDALHKFFRTAVTEFPFWKDDLKPKLEETLSRYVGRDASMGLYPTIQAIEDWLKQQLVVSFAADGGTSLTPLQQMGDGWQSLVRIASLDVLRQFPAEMKDRVVLLFEEPETYLHPHLRRKLRGVMADLAKLGWTVVCSTHAPEFLSFSESQMIVRLWRPGGSVTKGVLSTTAIPDGPRFDEKIGQTGNHEMLFAHRVVLCEGKDDEFAIRVFLEKADVDLNGKSVSVLGVGSVGNLPDYARIAQSLRIPWFAVTDEDKVNGQANSVTEKVRDELAALAGADDQVRWWPGKLESCLAVAGNLKATPAWQQVNLVPLDLATLRSRYADYASVCDAVRSWIA